MPWGKSQLFLFDFFVRTSCRYAISHYEVMVIHSLVSSANMVSGLEMGSGVFRILVPIHLSNPARKLTLHTANHRQ